MRTGPLVQRGAKVSRITLSTPSALRSSPSNRIFSGGAPRGAEPFANTIFKSSGLHLECRLPISLREFLANELGAVVDGTDRNVLHLAASADAATLSKLARAIRRYSTSRAQQAWAECSIALTNFSMRQGQCAPAFILCLKCVRIELAGIGDPYHHAGGCVSLSLQDACSSSVGHSAADTETRVADAIRMAIEEFRRLRAAFGLPHFELDSFVRNGQVTFTWRPLA